MILRAVAGAVQPARRAEQPGLEHGEMTDIVAAVEVIGREIRLEVARDRPFDAGFKQGLVRIQKARARLTGGLQQLVHRVRGQHVVVVQQREVFALGQCRGGIGIGRNAFVFHPAIAHLFFPGKKFAHIGVCRIGRISHAQLPVRAGLPGHTVPHLLKICARCIVHRHADRDMRPAGIIKRALAFQHGLRGQKPSFLLFSRRRAKPSARFAVAERPSCRTSEQNTAHNSRMRFRRSFMVCSPLKQGRRGPPPVWHAFTALRPPCPARAGAGLICSRSFRTKSVKCGL